MPKKRPMDIRMAEAEAKLEDMKLEKAISELRLRREQRRGIRRRRRTRRV